MRVLTSTLTTEQKLMTNPLYKVVFSKTSSTSQGFASNISNRIAHLGRPESEWSQTAQVVLDNADKTLTSDLSGWVATISYGYYTAIARSAWAANTAYSYGDIRRPITANGYQYRCVVAGTSHLTTEPTWGTALGVTQTETGMTITWEMDGLSGDEYSACAPLEVLAKKADTLYRQGILATSYSCAGVFNMMGEDEASADYSPNDTNTDTIKTILTAIANATMACFNHCKNYPIVFDSEDSLITGASAFKPADYFQVGFKESRLSAFKKALAWTGCKARIENTSGVATIHVFVPSTGTAIDVGSAATDRAASGDSLYTRIDKANPANLSGYITSIEVWATTGITGFRVGTFYLVSGTTYKCRDSATIGSVTAGSKQTIAVDSGGNALAIEVEAGDYIGSYFSTGGIEGEVSGGSGYLYVSGEYIDPDDSTSFTSSATGAFSLYGIGISYDYKYKDSVTHHNFFEKSVRNRVVIPNRVYVTSDPDHIAPYAGWTGNAADSDSYTALGRYINQYNRLRVTSNAQCTSIATAKLLKYQLGQEKGHGVAPINCGQEVMDYILITDSVAGDTRTGNIGYLNRICEPGKFEFEFRFGDPELGGISRLQALGTDAVTTVSLADRVNLLAGAYDNVADAIDKIYGHMFYLNDLFKFGWRMTESTVHIGTVAPTDVSKLWLDTTITPNVWKRYNTATSAWVIATPEDLDDVADGSTYGRILVTDISAGRVYLSDTTVFKAGYDPSIKRRVFVATPTTPYDLGDLWQQATIFKKCTTARASGAYVAGDWTAITQDEIDNGVTYSKVLTTDISAGHILLSSVTQSVSYRTVSDTEKGVWTGKPDDLDELGEGITYMKVLATNISSGRISLTAANYYAGKFSGEWYSMGAASGVDIDAASGINIYGKANALVTRATKTGTIQCYIGADGKIYAGAGAVALDAQGITISGQYLTLKDGVNLSFLYQSGTTLTLVSSFDCNVLISALGSGNIYLNPTGGVILSTNGAQLGTSDYFFPYGYISKLYLTAGAYIGTGTGHLQIVAPTTKHIYLYPDLGDAANARWVLPNIDSEVNLGASNLKFLNGYFDNLPACPVPTSNSALEVIKKIKAPKIMTDDRYGKRHYFLDEDFPDEMKMDRVIIGEGGKAIATGEREIEFVRTIGVLVQANRELLKRVEILEAR